tara:strand:+ start:1569 stop:2588 length:1020 start_codon:yes stop_codon:yes gene_type:complete
MKNRGLAQVHPQIGAIVNLDRTGGSGYVPMAGSGVLDKIKGLFRSGLNMIPSSDSNSTESFPGERHSILKLSNGLPAMASFQGPGTQVLKRLARGDKPRTVSDQISKLHDVNYMLAKDKTDIRKADDRMIKALNQASKDKTDSRINIAQGKLIKLKTYAEDFGAIQKGAFGGNFDNDYSQADLDLLEKAREEQEMKGYGKKTKGHPASRLIKSLAKKSKTKTKGASVSQLLSALNLGKITPQIRLFLGKKPTLSKIVDLIMKLMKIPKKHKSAMSKALKKDMSGDGFFDFIKKTASKVGNALKKAAPVIGKVAGIAALPAGFVNPALGTALGITSAALS